MAGMRWEDERYVRFYTRDTPEFKSLNWQARGLFGLILRKLDRAGIMKVGKLGLRGVAVAVEGPWVEIQPFLQELLDDGCVMFDEKNQVLIAPNFIEAQEANSSDNARKRKSREVARDLAASAVTRRDISLSKTPHSDDSATQKSRDVTELGHASHGSGHTRSRRSVPSVPSVPDHAEAELKTTVTIRDSDRPLPLPLPPPSQHSNRSVQIILDTLTSSKQLRELATLEFVKILAGFSNEDGYLGTRSLAAIVESIKEADLKISSEVAVGEHSGRKQLAAFVRAVVKGTGRSFKSEASFPREKKLELPDGHPLKGLVEPPKPPATDAEMRESALKAKALFGLRGVPDELKAFLPPDDGPKA